MDYVKGQRAPKAVLTTDKTDGPLPLTVQFKGSASSDADPGDSIRYEWDFGDGSPISTEANPTHIYTKAGRYTAILKVIDSSGQTSTLSTIITAGNTSPTVTVDGPIDGGLFTFGDKIQYKVTVTDPEDPSVNCTDVDHVRARSRHARSRRGLGHRLHGLPADRPGRRLARRQRVRRHLRDLHRQGWPGRNCSAADHDQPGADPSEAPGGRARRHPVRDDDGHQHRRRPRRLHRNSIATTDWLQLNGPFNLFQINTVVVPLRGSGRRPHGRVAAGGHRHPSGLDHGSGHRHGEPDLDGWHRHVGDHDGPAHNVAAGKHELFVTFRTVTGGTTGANLFNLNWLEFGGNGVTVVETSTPGGAGGTVPATLALSLGTPASFGPFTPGVARTYASSMTANVISTAGDATLSVADPSSTHPVTSSMARSRCPGPHGEGVERGWHRRRVRRAVGGSADRPDLQRAGVQRRGHDRVPAGHRRQRCAPYGCVLKTLTFTLSTTTP